MRSERLCAVLKYDDEVIAALPVAGAQDRGREHHAGAGIGEERLTFSSPVN